MKERTDKEFLSDLYIEYCDYLAVIVKNILFVDDSDEILSCVHQVFLIALEKIDIVRNHEQVKYWLAKTASYVAMDYNRKLRLHKHVRDSSILNTIPTDNFFDDELIEDMIWQDYKDKDLWNFITTKLKRKEKALLNLLCSNPYDNDGIAKSLGISMSALKSRKLRLKIKIKKILENFDGIHTLAIILILHSIFTVINI